MASGRNNKLTGQIGEYLVCAELGRRDLIATPFSGNVPTFDVLATDEMCRTVPIQVKASRSDNWKSDARLWMDIDFDIETKQQVLRGECSIANPDLIYVCVAIAKTTGQDRFFVLTKRELQRVCVDVYSAWMSPRDWKRPLNPESYDCRYSIPDISRFEDNWHLITQRLRASSPDTSLQSANENS